jgi:hypothetical protein
MAKPLWSGVLFSQASIRRGKKWRARYFQLSAQAGGQLAEYADVESFRDGTDGGTFTPLAKAIGVVKLGQCDLASASGRDRYSALRPSCKIAIILAEHVLMLEARDPSQLAQLLSSLRRVVPPLHVDACEWLRRKGTIKWKTRFYVLVSSGHLVRYSDDTLDNLIGFDDVRLATDVSFVVPTDGGAQGWGQQLQLREAPLAATSGVGRRGGGGQGNASTSGGAAQRGGVATNRALSSGSLTAVELPSGSSLGATVLVITTPLATIEISIDKGAVSLAEDRSLRLAHWHSTLEQRVRHRIACEGMDLAQLGPFLVLEAIRSRDFRASSRLRAGVREGGIPPALRTDAWGGFSGAQRRECSAEGMYRRLVAAGTQTAGGSALPHGALLDPELERAVLLGSIAAEPLFGAPVGGSSGGGHASASATSDQVWLRLLCTVTVYANLAHSLTRSP